MGSYLRGKTEGRRDQILALVEKDELAWVKDNKSKGRRDSEEWESVEGLAGDSGEKGRDGKDFDGIVGFFHPFWYVQPVSNTLEEC